MVELALFVRPVKLAVGNATSMQGQIREIDLLEMNVIKGHMIEIKHVAEMFNTEHRIKEEYCPWLFNVFMENVQGMIALALELG